MRPVRWFVALCLLTLAGCDVGERTPDASPCLDDTGTATPSDAAASGQPDASTPTPADGGPGHPDAASRSDASPSPDSGSSDTWLRDRYPGDLDIGKDPAVLFHDDFEQGWGRWSAPKADTKHLFVETGAEAHAGTRYLRSTVTHAQLLADQYISASPRVSFPRRTPTVFVRFYARFPNVSPNPHHWVRTAAGTPTFNSSGLANTVPKGDEGFWFDFDANTDSTLQFYAYWYEMRSGRCNDGTAVPGCAGDQGVTYYYGNVFRPPEQGSGIARGRWTCVEFAARANDMGQSNGELTAWLDDQQIGHFGPGHPLGTWLRAQFHPGGCSWSACTAPVPFEGFDFRSSADVLFKEFFLDAYYQRDTWEARRDEMQKQGLQVAEESTILYDDVVIASERIGCRR